MSYLEDRLKNISDFANVVETIAKQMDTQKVYDDMEKLSNYPEWKTFCAFFVNVRNHFADKAYDQIGDDDKTRYGRRMYTEGQLDAASLPLYIKKLKDKNKSVTDRVKEYSDKLLRKKYNPTL